MKKLLFLLLWSFPPILLAQVNQEKKIISQMLTACEQMKGARFMMASSEKKKDGSTVYKEILVKHQARPVRTYIYCIKPDAGSEVLWREGIINDHALVNPNGFPYVSLKLDLNNSLLRKDAHHSVKEIGFDYIKSMVFHYEKLLGEKFYSYLTIADTIQWDGKRIMRLVFDYADFAYSPYVIQKDENLLTIALTNYVSEYMILCANEKVDDFNDVKENQTIRIPNCFGKKVVFGIDLNTMLPLLQEVYNEKGLFEKYELKSFVINPKFDPSEFTPEYKGYNF
jgi:hypothetical protein